jgi:hypothetical protein
VDCSDLDDQCNTGVCNATTGACEPDPVPHEGDPCDDGDECTSSDGEELGGDTCQNGECVGDPVPSEVNVLKLTQGVVNPDMSWTFALYDGPNEGGDSSFLGNPLVSDATDSDTDGILDFGGFDLDPDETYTLCELGVPAGWATEWKVDRDGDGVAETIVIPYNPNDTDEPPADVGNRCFDLGAATSDELPCGEILNFEVDNTFPGGDPRTPGYWKNWNTCTGGNQQQTAEHNGGPAGGWFLLDDILNIPGVSWGDFTIETCEDGVLILDRRDLNSGRKRANDAAYDLASHLLAAQLNFAAGAETCQAAQDAAAAGEALLISIGFDGTGKFLRPKDALYTEALSLAATLDAYNNGDLCNPGTSATTGPGGEQGTGNEQEPGGEPEIGGEPGIGSQPGMGSQPGTGGETGIGGGN